MAFSLEEIRAMRDGPTVEGRKDDTAKDPWHLAPFDALAAIVKVLAYGAYMPKPDGRPPYGERNWETGMAWSRCYSALMRHMTDWWQGIDKGRGPGRDADTGYSDLWHAGCCALFLIAYEIRGVGVDDRPKAP